MAALLEKLREFDRMAGLLQMPSAERLGILNITEDLYSGLRSGSPSSVGSVRPEFERRLSYALPLMRRLASNSPVVGFPVGSLPRAASRAA